jgi:hypothetical protein
MRFLSYEMFLEIANDQCDWCIGSLTCRYINENNREKCTQIRREIIERGYEVDEK